MWIEIDDEFFPPRASLVGLRFESATDFQRCQALLWERVDGYFEVSPLSQMVVVRKADLHVFAEAGLSYTEVELTDMDDLPPEEVARIQRETIQKWMPVFIERLRRQG